MMLPTVTKDTDSSSSSSSVLPDQTCRRFTFPEIQSATNNFDETLVIGRGGFGNVYKCSTIGSAREVAVKRLHSMSNQGAHEFEAEVQVLSKLRHGNLVSLLGYCNEEKEMALIYEFMPNGTLEENLHKSDSSLSWLQLLKISIGAARGLDYLHVGTSTQHGVIHRDVKSSNILLDANFDAKIADFGLARIGLIDRTHVSTAVKGTFGYMDPSYFYTGKLTTSSDVYAFGVVLFEVLTGKKAVDSSLDEEQWSLAAWALHQIKVGKLNHIIDRRLIGQISKKCLKEFASIAGRCLHTQPKKRPTMGEVVFKLESILSQERVIAKSVVDEEGFVYKLRSFFTAKADATIESNAANNLNLKEHSPTLDEGVSGLDKSFGFLKNFGSKYELGEEIGTGHYAHIYKAKLKKGELTGQEVAVKIILKSKMIDAIAIEDVRREVKILRALKGHSNLGCVCFLSEELRGLLCLLRADHAQTTRRPKGLQRVCFFEVRRGFYLCPRSSWDRPGSLSSNLFSFQPNNILRLNGRSPPSRLNTRRLQHRTSAFFSSDRRHLQHRSSPPYKPSISSHNAVDFSPDFCRFHPISPDFKPSISTRSSPSSALLLSSIQTVDFKPQRQQWERNINGPMTK